MIVCRFGIDLLIASKCSLHEFFSSSFGGESSWSFLTTNFSGEAALAAATEAIEMPYVLTSTVKLVDNDPANVSDTAETVASYHCRLAHGTRHTETRPQATDDDRTTIVSANGIPTTNDPTIILAGATPPAVNVTTALLADNDPTNIAIRRCHTYLDSGMAWLA